MLLFQLECEPYCYWTNLLFIANFTRVELEFLEEILQKGNEQDILDLILSTDRHLPIHLGRYSSFRHVGLSNKDWLKYQNGRVCAPFMDAPSRCTIVHAISR